MIPKRLVGKVPRCEGFKQQTRSKETLTLANSRIAQIEEDLESLDYITIEECLENNPELAKEIDEEIERQEW